MTVCLRIASRHSSVHLHSAVVTLQARHAEVPFGFDRDTRPTAPCGQPAKGWLSAWICRTFPSQVTCGVMVAVLKTPMILTMLPLLAFPKGFLPHSTSFKIRLSFQSLIFPWVHVILWILCYHLKCSHHLHQVGILSQEVVFFAPP